MKKNVVRQNGVVINIGPWDNLDGSNPLPEGAVEAEEDVCDIPGGGFAAVSDYVTRRRAEYPPIVDQLDALWKGGADADAMRDTIVSVKARHPKAS
jgi:hypothetical protein